MPLLTTLLALSVFSTKPDTELVLTGFDPIDLLAGRQIKGFATYKADYLRFRYYFSSLDHLQLFQSDPEKYAVQDGGACGKMGVLTGKGAPDRFAVLKDRIYLFASEGCRTGVLSNPDPYFAPIPKAPKASAADEKIAKSMYAKVRRAHGLTKGQTLPQVQLSIDTPYVQNGKKLVWHEYSTFINQDTVVKWWGTEQEPGFFAASGSRDAEGNLDQHFRMAKSERRALFAEFLRHPIGVLGGSMNDVVAPLPINAAGETGFVTSSQTVVSEILIDPKTKKIKMIRFTDHASGPVRTIETRFSNYKKIEGVWLPYTSQRRIVGKDWQPEVTYSQVVVGGKPPSFLPKIFR